MAFSVEPSVEISHRIDFSVLCNARGFQDAVEVGVDLGVNARDFLSRWNGSMLVLVDPYEPYEEMPWHGRQLDMMTAVQSLAPYHGRFRFIMAPSVQVAKNWPPWITRPGFIYIDGSHKESDVANDLEAWWDTLEPNGILAGHDHDSDHPGVIAAVKNFASKRGSTVRLTHETSSLASWYIYKNEPDKLIHRCFREGESDNPHRRTVG